MGFVKGKTVEVLLNAPLKDPVKYKVMGYEISLRHQEAEMIEIVGEQEMLRDAVHLDYHEGMSEDMRLSEEELKRIALGKRRTFMSISWVVRYRLRSKLEESTTLIIISGVSLIMW